MSASPMLGNDPQVYAADVKRGSSNTCKSQTKLSAYGFICSDSVHALNVETPDSNFSNDMDGNLSSWASSEEGAEEDDNANAHVAEEHLVDTQASTTVASAALPPAPPEAELFETPAIFFHFEEAVCRFNSLLPGLDQAENPAKQLLAARVIAGKLIELNTNIQHLVDKVTDDFDSASTDLDDLMLDATTDKNWDRCVDIAALWDSYDFENFMSLRLSNMMYRCIDDDRYFSFMTSMLKKRTLLGSEGHRPQLDTEDIVKALTLYLPTLRSSFAAQALALVSTDFMYGDGQDYSERHEDQVRGDSHIWDMLILGCGLTNGRSYDTIMFVWSHHVDYPAAFRALAQRWHETACKNTKASCFHESHAEILHLLHKMSRARIHWNAHTIGTEKGLASELCNMIYHYALDSEGVPLDDAVLKVKKIRMPIAPRHIRRMRNGELPLVKIEVGLSDAWQCCKHLGSKTAVKFRTKPSDPNWADSYCEQMQEALDDMMLYDGFPPVSS